MGETSGDAVEKFRSGESGGGDVMMPCAMARCKMRDANQLMVI